MLILGIETSCDETAAAVVKDGKKILSNIVASQDELHVQFGGVVPEIACRAHLESIVAVIDAAISMAGIGLADLNAIAVTNTPGLIGSLLIGLTAAKTISWALNIPIVAVNHIYAHLYSVNFTEVSVQYPLVGLVASGGHTCLFLVRGETDYVFLGGTLDDAAGEAFDKVSNILGLGYPGGPKIDAVSKNGNRNAVPFPRSYLAKDSLDFSFSGLKTSVLYYCQGKRRRRIPRRGFQTSDLLTHSYQSTIHNPNLQTRNPQSQPPNPQPTIPNPEEIADIAASFQEAVVEVLVNKTIYAFSTCSAKGIAVGGGVARNTRLRERFDEAARDKGIPVCYPSTDLCTDNAAMIAGLAYHKYLKGNIDDLSLEAIPNLIATTTLTW